MNSRLFWGVTMIISALAGIGVSRVSFTESMRLGSSISVIIFALPSLIALTKWLRLPLSIVTISILSLCAYTFEIGSIKLGFPYGFFTYSSSMAYKLFNTVPWNVPFAWIPVVVGAVSIAKNRSSPFWVQLLISTSILLFFDLLLDPVAVLLHFWTWQVPGQYYTIPLSNFLGWILSGAIGSALLLLFGKKLGIVPAIANRGFGCIVLFWTASAVSLKLVLPVMFGVLLLIIIFWHSRKDCFQK